MGDLFVLSVLWTLCCIPVITIIPASAALYYATTKSVRKDHGNAFPQFWKAFRENLRQGVIINIMFLAFLFVVLLWFGFSNQFDPSTMQGIIFVVISRALIITFALGVPLLAPLLSRFSMKVLEFWMNSYFIAVRHILTVLLVLVELLIGAYLLYAFPPFLIIVPGTIALLTSYAVEPIFLRYIKTTAGGGKDYWFLKTEED